MEPASNNRNALVLTGGGARAAYQVGALRAIAEITQFKKNPFRIISGYSAGAINGAWLAGRSENFAEITQSMWDEWASLTPDKVFNTTAPNVAVMAFRWLMDRIFGGNKHQISYLLDTSPLKKLIETQVHFDGIQQHVQSGELHGISFTAANYNTGQSISFFSGSDEIPEWHRLNRISVRAELTATHVMASSAIPIFFPPVRLGDSHYGDGMVRLNAPLSAAIHMGAEKMLVIGIRGPSSTTLAQASAKHDNITLGEIAGTVLNGLFFDSLDADLDRMQRMNRTLSHLSPEAISHQPDHLRHIPVMSLKPTQEVGALSSCQITRLPPTLRFLLRGIGLSENKGLDLLSYLSFEPKYLTSLLEQGYADTMLKKEEVQNFFLS